MSKGFVGTTEQGGQVLAFGSRDIAVARYRRAHGHADAVHEANGAAHVFVSLSRGQRLEARKGRRSVSKKVVGGEVTILYSNEASRIISAGSVDLIHLMLPASAIADFAPRHGVVEQISQPAPLMEKLGYGIAKAIWDGEAEDDLFLSSLSQAAVELLAPAKRSPVRGGLPRRKAEAVVDFVDGRVSSSGCLSPSLADLAAVAGLSAFHFSREFSRNFGMSPYRFVLHRKLEKARDLLAFGNQDLAGVASLTGFCSPSHLVAAFKREMGVSPIRFRNIVRSQNQYCDTRATRVHPSRPLLNSFWHLR